MSLSTALALRRIVPAAGAALLLYLNTGCSVVTVPEPIGDEVTELDPSEWEGIWEDNSGIIFGIDDPVIFQARVPDPASGEIELAALVENDDDELVPRFVTVTIRGVAQADWEFASYTVEGAQGQFLWGRIVRMDDYVLVWAPDADKFKELVEQGRLRGTIDNDDNVNLETPTSEELASIAEEEWGMLFFWDEPLIYRRISPNTQ